MGRPRLSRDEAQLVDLARKLGQRFHVLFESNTWAEPFFLGEASPQSVPDAPAVSAATHDGTVTPGAECRPYAVL